MLKNAYMLQGSYGSFGLTAAMLRRCEEFLARGINCVSLTLDFTPNIYDYVEKSKANGKVPTKLNCMNPYIEVSKKADAWFNDVGTHIASCFLLAYLDNDTVIYYKTNGYKLNQKSYSQKDRVSYFEHEGKVINEVFLVNGIKVELNYSLNGLCISIREFDNKTNQQLKCLIFDYSLGVIKYYKSSYQWNVEWIKRILPTQENTLLICDGPGSARKLQHIKRENIRVIYILHHNHRHANGDIVKRDEWNLNNKDKFDSIVALTERHKKDLVKDFGDGNFYNILNFTKVKEFNFEGKVDCLRIGFFGQLIDRKGVNDAIRAVAILHKKYKLPVELEIFGGTLDPKDINKSIAKYEKVVKEENLEEFVNFRGYTLEVAKEMAACYCILFPSYSEAQGLSIVEAMHLGVPVIAYDCKYGPSTMIENGKTGYLCEVGNIEELAENASTLLKDRDLRERMSNSAKHKSKEFTDSDYIFQQWQCLFSDLFSKKN